MGPGGYGHSRYEGNRYIIVMVDCFSRLTEACPLPNKMTLAVADAFFQLIVWPCLWGGGGENHDDWDDLLPAVMMHTTRVHESTGFSPYRLMFGEECTLPMDMGIPRRTRDVPDPINNRYALWVPYVSGMLWKLLMIRSVAMRVRQFGDKNASMISGLLNVCSL